MDQEISEQIEKLYLELFPSLYRYAFRCINSESLAEEAVQEAFRIACGKPDDLLRCEKPLGWLMVTVRNVCRNMYRRRDADKKLLMDYIMTHDAWTEEHRSVELLYTPLAKTKEFRLIRAIAIDGKSVQEIAEEQGISIEACYKRIQRARKILQKKI